MLQRAPITIETGKDKCAAKIIRRGVADVGPAQARGELERVHTRRHRQIIAQLTFMAFERIVSNLRAATCERIEHD